MRRMRVFLATGAALILLFSSACSDKLSRQAGLTDAELFSRGQKFSDQKRYKAASEAFQNLLERFPTSPLASRAQFGLASSRMANKDEIEAEVAFDDFLRLYPADPKVPDALFMKGNLLSRQVLPPGKDQVKTRDAIKTYTLFLERDPGSPRAQEASGKIRELRNRLALHGAAVVNHFLSRKLFDSAEARARRAAAAYPDVPASPMLLSLLAQALEKQGKRDEAATVMKTITEKYPEWGKKR